jgi:hypothetical protein
MKPRTIINHLPEIYFLHIPKTAGTSFRLWLHRLFDVDDLLPIDHLNELEELELKSLKRKRFASGHFGWRLMELSKTARASFDPVTILREPVDHVLSGLRYTTDIAEDDIAKLGEGADRHREMGELILASFHDASLSPEEATAKLGAEAAEIEGQFSNITLRFIALSGTEDTSAPPTGERELALAQARLDAMRFFGLVEDWGGTAILFADAYGLPLRAMDYRHNPTPGRKPKVPKAFLDGVRKTHSLDLKLYDYARSLFNERLAAARQKFGLAPDAGFEEFREPLLQQFLHTDRGLPLMSKATVPLSAGIIENGFDRRFPDQAGRWRLWSDPALESSLYLPLDRSQPLVLRFQGDVFLSNPIRDELRVEVDGSDVAIEKRYVKAGDGYRVRIDVPVPADPDAGQYSAITFIVPELVPQHDEALAPATAFALGGSIKIAPAPVKAVAPPPEPPRALSDATIPISPGIRQDGFARCYPAEAGRWHIWSGPALESSLYLPLDRSQPLLLSFQGDVFLSDAIRDELRIEVDGSAMPITRSYVTAGDSYLVQMDVLVPADPEAGQDSKVTFIVPETVAQDDEALAPATAFALGGSIKIAPAPAEASIPEPPQPLSDATVPISPEIRQDGFAQCYPAGDGNWRLWSGPALEASLYLPLDRSQPLRLSFQGDVFLSDAIRDELRIEVDGSDLPIERSYVKAGDSYLVQMDVLVPADPEAGQYSTITFIVPETVAQDDEALAPATAFALGGAIQVSRSAEDQVPGDDLRRDEQDERDPSDGVRQARVDAEPE